MRAKTSAVLLSLALAAGASAATASAATAASAAPAATAAASQAGPAGDVTGGIRIQDSLVLRSFHTQANPLQVYFEVDLIHAGGIKAAGASITGPNDYLYGIDLVRKSGTRYDGTYIGRAWFTKYATPGRYHLKVDVWTDKGEHLAGPDQYLSVKRNTSMPAFNAGPEPVRKGRPITVGGRLTRLHPDRGYVGYPGRTVTVYFRPDGGAWTRKGSTTTDRSGRWARRFTARADGVWQARFAGTSRYDAETSRADHVDVR